MEHDRAALHREVRRLVTEAGTRRALPSVVHLGDPGAERQTLAADGSLDAGLRVDALSRMLEADPTAPVCWLTRSGHPTIGDQDLVWFGAMDAAFARHGRHQAPFYVVTRHGWIEVRSGAGRTWRRVRARRPSAPPG